MLKSIPEGSGILDAVVGEQKYKEYCSHLEYAGQDFDEYGGLGIKSFGSHYLSKMNK